jgi:TPR repeat protein
MAGEHVFVACLAIAAIRLVVDAPVSAQIPAAPVMARVSSDPIGQDVRDDAEQWLGGDRSARQRLEALARAGRADAQETLGEVLFHGDPSGADIRTLACGYFSMASRTRRDALHSFAHCVELGVSGSPNPVQAARLYQQAADGGYAKSMCALGNLYIAGRGVPKDAERGAGLCLRGAEAGDKDAQADLGNLYLHGVGVAHDMVQARRWLELAAAQHQANAQFNLGKIYWNGDGIARDQMKAAALWKAAYAGGRTDAASLLASWAMIRWIKTQSKEDIATLDEAIAWEELAMMTAPDEATRAGATARLDAMRAAREAAAAPSK